MVAVLGHFALLEQYSKAGWVTLGFKMRMFCSQKLISSVTACIGAQNRWERMPMATHAPYPFTHLDVHGCVEALSAQFAAEARVPPVPATQPQQTKIEKGGKARPPLHMSWH